MTKQEKIAFILEQVRLCLDKHDYIRAHILAKKVSPKAFATGTSAPKTELDRMDTGAPTIPEVGWRVSLELCSCGCWGPLDGGDNNDSNSDNKPCASAPLRHTAFAYHYLLCLALSIVIHLFVVSTACEHCLNALLLLGTASMQCFQAGLLSTGYKRHFLQALLVTMFAGTLCSRSC